MNRTSKDIKPSLLQSEPLPLTELFPVKSRNLDSNQGPPGPKPGNLPTDLFLDNNYNKKSPLNFR